MKRFNFKYFGGFILFALLALVPLYFSFRSFFGTEHLAFGDAPFYFPEGLKDLVGIPLTWTDKGVSFGGPNLVLWLSPIMYVYGSLFKYFEFNNDIVTRVLFYFPSVILSLAGPYFLTRYLKLSKTVQFFSSLFYVLNTYFLLIIDGGQVGVALAYGMFPFAILFWKRFLDKTDVNRFFAMLVVSFVLCYIDTRITLVVFIFVFLWQILATVFVKGFEPIRKLVWLLVVGILLIPLNLYWLLPLVKSGSVNLSVSVSGLNLTSLLNTLLLFAPHWPSNIFGKVVAPYFYFVLFPVLIFGSFIFKQKDRKLFLFAFMFLVFAFVAKGGTPPFGDWYELFVNKIPSGSVFRDSTKFFIPLILLGGILIGSTVEAIIYQLKNKVLKIFLWVFVYAYLIFLISPAILGKLNFNLGSRTESSDYQIIYDHLKNDDGFFRTLWVPEKPQMGFDSLQKPAVNARDLASFRPFVSINSSEDVFNFLNKPKYIEWLKILGVRYIFLPGDQRNLFPTADDAKNWNEILSLVAKTPGVTKVDWGTSMAVYKIFDTAPEAFSVSRIIAVVGPDLPAESTGIVSSVYLEDGKFDPRLLLDKNPDSIKLFFNTEEKADLTMSFLQKHFKSVKDFKASQWATYAAGDYLKSKYELLIRGYKYNDFDFGRGITFSTKTDEKINFQFRVPENGNYIIAVRSSDFQKQKFSWTFETRVLTKGEFSYEVVNKTGFEVLNTVALIPEREFASASNLADSFISRYGTVTAPQLQDFTINNAILEQTSTLKYKFVPQSSDNWLILTENYNPGWGEVFPVYSMVNGFYVSGQKSFEFEYAPQRWFSIGASITEASIIILAVVFLGLKAIKK